MIHIHQFGRYRVQILCPIFSLRWYCDMYFRYIRSYRVQILCPILSLRWYCDMYFRYIRSYRVQILCPILSLRWYCDLYFWYIRSFHFVLTLTGKHDSKTKIVVFISPNTFDRCFCSWAHFICLWQQLKIACSINEQMYTFILIQPSQLCKEMVDIMIPKIKWWKLC